MLNVLPTKVSIIMRTYNRANLLRRSIRSVQEQTLQRWELLVVNDASTDDTASFLASRAATNPRIRPIRREVNSRRECPRVEPMNDGLKAATGAYIAYLDDDNQWEPDYLTTLSETLDRDSNLVLVYGDTRDHYSIEALENLKDDRERWVYSKTCVVFPHMPAFPGYRVFASGNGYVDYIDTNEMMHTRAALTAIGGEWPVAHESFEDINAVQGVTHRTHNDLAVAEALIEQFGTRSVKYIPRALTNYVHRSHRRYNDGNADFRAM